MDNGAVHHHYHHHNHHTHVRHSQWLAVMAFTVVAIIATERGFKTEHISDESKQTQWLLSALSVILTLATVATGAHFVNENQFAGSIMEGVLAFVATGMGAAVMPSLMDPDHLLAVASRHGKIMNPNLYFFTWASFITSYLVLFGTAMHWHEKRQCAAPSSNTQSPAPAVHGHHHHHGCSAARRGGTAWMWSLLVLTSIVVLVTAVRMFQEGECSDIDTSGDPTVVLMAMKDPTLITEDRCDRILVALGVATISTIMSLAWPIAVHVYFLTQEDNQKPHRTKVMGDLAVTGFLVGLWTFTAAWLTSDKEKSPATALSNMYFFIWGSWINLLFLVMHSIQQLKMTLSNHQDTTTTTLAITKGSTADKNGAEPGGDLAAVPEMDVSTDASHEDKNAECEA